VGLKRTLCVPSILASKQLVIAWDGINKEFAVSWDGVFYSQHPLRFEVSAGTALGGSNIIQWLETRDNNITFSISDSTISTSRLNVHINVRGIAAGGNYDDIQGFIILPP
jgi:hypothetical protein